MKFGTLKIVSYILIVGGLAGIIYLIIVRFQNPSLTETELFIQYWDTYLTAIILSLTGIFILEKEWND